jgi:hypothetical protein
VDPKRRMLVRTANRQPHDTRESGERGGSHGGLIKGLTGFATFAD